MVTGENLLLRAQQKLANCHRDLSKWSSQKFGISEAIQKTKTKLLVELQKQENPSNLKEIKKIQGEIDLLLEQEDLWWKQ